MTIIKKITSIVLSLAMMLMIIPISHIHADGNMSMDADDNATLVDEEKIYCKATIDDNFADNRVIVVLKHDASMEFKTYDASDFPQVNAKSVNDLTHNTVQMAKAKVHGADVVMSDGTTFKSDNEINIDTYNQIITIELAETGKDKVLEAIKELEKIDAVKYVGPDFAIAKASGTTSTNDTYRGQQWALDKTSIPDAWDSYVTDAPIINVGVMDTGIDATHPDLQGRVNISLSRNFLGGQTTTSGATVDYDGHGTLVSGIIAANTNNSTGISGICWSVGLVSLKVLNSDGSGYSSFVESAIDYATYNSIHVLNCSLGWYGYSESYYYYDVSLYECIENYFGIIVCAAGNADANNDAEDTMQGFVDVYPADYDLPNIIVVGASTFYDEKEENSNYGANNVDIFAPGDSILSCYPVDLCNNNCTSSTPDHHQTGYHYAGRTSLAAPHVTGVVALMMQRFPVTNQAIKDAIINSADQVSALTGLCVANGRLNAYEAMRSLDEHTHIYEYTNTSSETTHRVDCTICSYWFTETHTMRTTNTGIERCIRCSYTSHVCSSYSYTNINATSHRATCLGCGASHTESHGQYTYSSVSDILHKTTCGKCGATKNESHSNTYTSIGIASHRAVCRYCNKTRTENHTFNEGGTVCTRCNFTFSGMINSTPNEEDEDE